MSEKIFARKLKSRKSRRWSLHLVIDRKVKYFCQENELQNASQLERSYPSHCQEGEVQKLKCPEWNIATKGMSRTQRKELVFFAWEEPVQNEWLPGRWHEIIARKVQSRTHCQEVNIHYILLWSGNGPEPMIRKCSIGSYSLVRTRMHYDPVVGQFCWFSQPQWALIPLTCVSNCSSSSQKKEVPWRGCLCAGMV